jgi:hypothetical protein
VLEKPHLRDGARKRTAEKLFRRGGLTWGAGGLARDAGKTGTSHFLQPKPKLECTSLFLVSSLGATPHDSATHLSETISSPIGCQHISHAGALYCTVVQQRLLTPALQLPMQLRINQIPVPKHTVLDRITTPASQEPRWNSYY